MSSAALAYHEPGIVDILILSSFLLILNIINSIIDGYLYCGLIGQILIGIAWGAPGASWLSIAAQETITQLGYLGLILLVFEGGLSTSFSALKSNLLLSVGVASVGILVPIALSFCLMGIANASPLQAFAAGAALCSTSLGTTFSLLSSSGLVTSRLGIVLSSAAMLDDLVGLVMVQIISNLGTAPSLSAVTVVRPILVSLAFATLLPLVCVFIIKPAIHSEFWHRQRSTPKWMNSSARRPPFAFVAQALLLIAFITGASYAGTSNLFTSYLAGATISWWYDENAVGRQTSQAILGPPLQSTVSKNKRSNSTNPTPGLGQTPPNNNEKTETMIPGQHQHDGRPGATEIYEQFFQTPVHRILKPFFFASIGFSIPISMMFSGPIIWRGIVYSILMILGKLTCGVCLFPSRALYQRLRRGPPASNDIGPGAYYPSSILGFAMVARGEIGFLISATAESGGIYSRNDDSDSDTASDLFLIVSWAIVLCTIIGPICVGLFIRQIERKKVLQNLERESDCVDNWGIWGMKAT